MKNDHLRKITIHSPIGMIQRLMLQLVQSRIQFELLAQCGTQLLLQIAFEHLQSLYLVLHFVGLDATGQRFGLHFGQFVQQSVSLFAQYLHIFLVDAIQMVLEHVGYAALAIATAAIFMIALHLLQMDDFVAQPRTFLVYHIE